MAEATLYNPASLKEDDLIANFVVRTKTFERIFKDIKNSDMHYPEKHYLIQGQRGMGKTTLLLRLKYEVERTESLNDWLVPVFFNEEAYDLNSLSSLWERLLKYLDDYFDTDGEYYDYTDQFVDREDYERLCFTYLIEKLHERGKKLIIFFDNFGELFLDNLKEKEKRRFREILIQCSDIRIIGASAVVINDLHDYSQPFFEFFHIVHLDGLSKDETYDLIAKMQEHCPEGRRIDLKKHKAKIDTLSILTGGVIRTIRMLYQVLLDDPNGKALEDLEKVLDKVTPLYKHRIEDLPLQQRRIVDVIAKKWDAVSAKEIAAEIREDGKKLQTKLISAQLAQLERNNVIEKKATTTKNHLYQLRERFFNIWYLMRNGDRRDKKRVAWLTKFLEIWYDDKDSFDAFVNNHILALRSGKYIPSSALLMVEALANSDKFDVEKVDGLVDETSNVLKEDQLQYLPNMRNRRIAVAFKYFEANNLEKSIEALSGVKEKDTKTYLLLAFFFQRLDEASNAKEILRNVNTIDNDDIEFFTQICIDLKQYEHLFKVVHQSPEIDQARVDEVVGDAHSAQNMLDLAIKHYEKAISLGRSDVWKKLKDVYERKGELKKVEELLLKAYDKGGISRKPIMDFYAMKSVDFVKLSRWMEDAEKDGDYFLYLSLITLNNPPQNDVWKEMVANLEKSIELFGLEKSGSKNMILSATILLTYHIKVSKDLQAALEVLKKADPLVYLTGFNPYNVLKAFVLVWDRDYKDSFMRELFGDFYNYRYDNNLELFSDFLILLLSRHQYHFLQNQFEENSKLKDLFKPIYFALMTLLEDEMPNEILKMGEELKIPVEEILQRVGQMKEDYK